MQAPGWALRFFGWRWMPSVALVSGSLAFVGLAVVLVPDDLGAVASGTDRLTRATRSRLGANASPADIPSPSSVGDQTGSAVFEMPPAAAAAAAVPTLAPPGNIVQSIFHSTPKIELPVEPVDPAHLEPPPPPPPPPPPTATIFTLPSPPPPAANTVMPPSEPQAPSEPQGITGQGVAGQ